MVAKRTLGPAGAGSDDTARQAAADAAAAALSAANAAANARQMVLNRDPALAALQATADTASQAMSSSAADRADLRALLVAEQAALVVLQAVVAALPAPVVIATGQAKTASLLALGSSMDLVVTLSRTMPTATYNVEILPVSTGLLPGAATIAVKAKTRTTATLTVTATVAVAASAVVSVLAWG